MDAKEFKERSDAVVRMFQASGDDYVKALDTAVLTMSADLCDNRCGGDGHHLDACRARDALASLLEDLICALPGAIAEVARLRAAIGTPLTGVRMLDSELNEIEKRAGEKTPNREFFPTARKDALALVAEVRRLRSIMAERPSVFIPDGGVPHSKPPCS